MKSSSSKGFTLVELSIVLVIIGLIIGGVLTGQQIIQNARITNAINAIQGYQSQFQTYVQNYGALPGDDPSATSRFPAASLNTSLERNYGNGDNAVGTSSSFATKSTAIPESESLLVWAHLRAAGLVKNQQSETGTAIQPPNPFNGVFGFQSGAFADEFKATTLCMDKVPTTAAQAIDARLDDGESNAGAIRAGSEGVTAASSKSYGTADTYTVCIRM